MNQVIVNERQKGLHLASQYFLIDTIQKLGVDLVCYIAQSEHKSVKVHPVESGHSFLLLVLLLLILCKASSN